MKNQSIKNLVIVGLTLLGSGFLSAQFVIPSGINNALQIIKTILITADGTQSGTSILDINNSGKVLYSSGIFSLDLTGEFSQTRRDYQFINTSALQPYGNTFVGEYYHSGSVGFLGGSSVDLIGGLADLYGNGVPSFVWKYMLNNQPHSQVIFDPDNIAFNMNSTPGTTGTTFTFGITNTNASFIDDTTITRNISTQWINSNSQFVLSILNDRTVGIGTPDPQNNLDINIPSPFVPGTLGLRLSLGAGNSGQILGLDNNGDVVMLGNISGFGGGGGTGPWETGLGGLGSVQTIGGNNDASGVFSLVGGQNNISIGTHGVIVGGQNNTGLGGYGFIGGGVNNLNDADGGFIGGGGDNTIYMGDTPVIVGGGQNTIYDGGHNSIVGGIRNSLSGEKSVIVGGDSNTLFGGFGFIGGGDTNSIDTHYGFIGAGKYNTIQYIGIPSMYTFSGVDMFEGEYNSILGGIFNLSQGLASTIGGGIENMLHNGLAGFIGAGMNNEIFGGLMNFLGGGADNIIGANSISSIVGGQFNKIYADGSAIVGGTNNSIGNSMDFNAYSSFIGGGAWNSIQSAGNGFIGGGVSNTLSNSQYGVIVGGNTNAISGSQSSFIGGGQNNTTTGGSHSSIVGGYQNSISGSMFGSIGGGLGNQLFGTNSVIAGGSQNTIYGNNGFIGGGDQNIINGAFSFIGGGELNIINGMYGFVGGGLGNIASGDYATIVGGSDNKAYGLASFAAGRFAEALHDNIFIRNDGSLNPFTSTISNMFLINASNGVAINTNTRVSGSNAALTVNGIINAALPAFANDASTVGLVAGDLYQTNGTAPAPLNVPGIVMIKQ